jgi:hypothetical protein
MTTSWFSEKWIIARLREQITAAYAWSDSFCSASIDITDLIRPFGAYRAPRQAKESGRYAGYRRFGQLVALHKMG